jgi:hypothetical protein
MIAVESINHPEQYALYPRYGLQSGARVGGPSTDELTRVR